MLMPPTISAPRKRPLLVSNIPTDSEASGSDASGGPAAAFPTAHRHSVRKKKPSLKARQAAEGAVDVDDAASQPAMSDDDELVPT
jgi:hypothetical protein